MLSVSTFIASLGVNTHMDETSTGYGNVALVAKSLAYLGIDNIRDHAWSQDLPAYRQLIAGGVKLDLIVDDNPIVSTAAMVPIRAAITSFEGSNEVDIQHVPVAQAVAEQQLLYATVKANPLLNAIPVLNESIGDPNNYAAYAASTAFSDGASIHAYAAWGDMPRYAIPSRLDTETLAGKPSVITETGYFTMLNPKVDPSGVSESVQARMELDALFDGFKAGVSQTYLYELLDQAPDPGQTNPEMHYGLFNADGTPKLAATALHDLTTILTAPALSATTPSLQPTFTGLSGEANTLLLAGAKGETLIAIWAEPQVWNTEAATELPTTTDHVTVSLGAVVGTVSVYDPTVGTAPIATYHNVSQISLDVTDHPLIVRASGQGSLRAPSATTSRAALDRLAAPPGNRVVDAASGSVMAGSASAKTSFFVDPATSPHSVITNMHVGDSITLWGFTGPVSALSWQANQTQAGYTGATLHAATTHGQESLTFATATMHEVNTMAHVSTGSVSGVAYLRVTEIA